MSMNLMEVMWATDWPLLRSQKVMLLAVIGNPFISVEEERALDGILNWIDNIQDAAVASGMSETTVFGACALEDEDDT